MLEIFLLNGAVENIIYCPYCKGEMSLEAGVLRTFGSLQVWHSTFEAGGSKMKDMRKFKNMNHPSLIKGDKDTTILL